MYRRELKLIRNGNSVQVTLPREVLTYLGWLAGERIILELTANKTVELYPPRMLQRVDDGPGRGADDPRPELVP